MLLNQLKSGLLARIRSVEGGKQENSRLLEMGLIPGQFIQVSRTAPLGDPISVQIMGYELCLRLSEASLIDVEVLS